jgi:hypothetical protein
MKDTIYTIPVTEAFESKEPCAFCVLEKKLEDEYTDYYLGAALMEPDHRMDTNEKGFCKKHFEMLYNRQENRLGLGLIINTHINEQLGKIKEEYDKVKVKIAQEAGQGIGDRLKKKMQNKKSATDQYIDEMQKFFNRFNDSCAICAKEEYTIGRYIDVMFHLWATEASFKEKFDNRDGFCLKHTELLINGANKHLKSNNKAVFIKKLMDMEIKSLDTLNGDIEWFTKKFDYRYQNEPWKNSKDAIPRAIEKLKGFCRFK